MYLLLIKCIYVLLYDSYTLLYVEDNMPIHRHVIMTDVTRTVLVSKCTL
jgi:hypothetical protein